MDLRNNNFLIIGLGKTGIETAKFLHREKAKVKASDYSKFEKLPGEISELIDLGIEVETGKHSPEILEWADILVISPGVSFNTKIIADARRKGKKVVSEIELAHYFISKPIIGITGTNGKTTTTSLISEILINSGINVFTGGNIGTPLVSIAGNDSKYDYILLELSSFQLQGVINFRPQIGAILNISPNHLDHHESYGEYVESKFNLFKNQKKTDWAVFNNEDELIKSKSSEFRGNKVSFGKSSDCDIHYQDSAILSNKSSYELKNVKLLGKHNIENIMAAIAVSEIVECSSEIIQDSINNFKPLPHRIEYISTVRGVRIYNDSKSTTPDSTIRAIESFDSPVILLAGGKDKGVNYEVLKNIIETKVKKLVLIGEAKNKMKKQLGSYTDTVLADNLKDALEIALLNSEPSDTLLFSPACSSFDMFNSYEERGRIFKEIVQGI